MQWDSKSKSFRTRTTTVPDTYVIAAYDRDSAINYNRRWVIEEDEYIIEKLLKSGAMLTFDNVNPVADELGRRVLDVMDRATKLSEGKVPIK